LGIGSGRTFSLDPIGKDEILSSVSF